MMLQVLLESNTFFLYGVREANGASVYIEIISKGEQ